jgi:protein ImuB
MNRSPRQACLLVADLPLRAALRARPELADVPFVVATGSDAQAEVVAVSPAARRAGARAGSSLTHARAVSSDVRVQVISPALERVSRQALLDVALSFSPRAMLAQRSAWAFSSEAAVLLDASGIQQLYESERHFASALAAQSEALGLPGAVAIASSRTVARIAARHSANTANPLCVVPAGAEASFLAPIPIDLLDPSDPLGQQLTRFGIHVVRDLLRLPRRALATRLGPDVLELVARIRGETVESPLPLPADSRLEEAIDLDYPVDRAEPLLFVLRGLLSRLMQRLELRHLASGPLDLQLHLEGGGRDTRQVGVAGATRDVRVLLRLIALSLETHPSDAPVEAVCVATEGLPERRDQLDLFRPRGPDPNNLDRTLTELEALCGSDRVGSPEVADDHRPDAFGLKPFEPHRTSRVPDLPTHTEPTALVVRALRPAIAAEVRVNRGLPTQVRSAVSNGDIVRVSGPWRTTGRWWSDTDRYALDHFDIQVSDGTVSRLCFDWHKRCWRIDGLYD